MPLPKTATLTFSYKKFALHAGIGLFLTIALYIYQWPYEHSYQQWLHLLPSSRSFVLCVIPLVYTLLVCGSCFIFSINPYNITVDEDGLDIEGFEKIPWSRVQSVSFTDVRSSSSGFSNLLIDIATLGDPRYQQVWHVSGTWRTKFTDSGLNLSMSFPLYNWFMDGTGNEIESLATHYINLNLQATCDRLEK